MRTDPRRLSTLTTTTLALLLAVTPAAGAASLVRPGAQEAASSFDAAVSDRLADLAASLDYDPERIFRFVADEIRYEPYVGILRGAHGTLDAGAGNSADQALLLAALLDESLMTYRFARGPLDEAAAAALADSSLLAPAESAAALELALDGGPFPEEQALPEAEPADAAEAAEVTAAAEAALEASDAQVADSVALITAALAGAGHTLGGEGAEVDRAALLPPAEAAEHTWLQVASGADWLDMDPSLGAEAAVGDSAATPAEALDALPDELRHLVRFEVLLEQVRNGRLEVVPVIEYAAFADELAGQPITFGHIPPDATERLGVAISSVFGEATLSYHPVLELAGGTIVSNDAAAFGTSSAVGGGGGLLDDSDLFEAPSAAPGTLADGEATAEWLAVTVESPGAEAVTAQRAVFDRVPAEVRYGSEPTVADVQPIELTAFVEGGQEDFAPMLGSTGFAIVTGPTNGEALFTRSAATDASILPIFATAYAGLRDIIGSREGVIGDTTTFVDRPGVVAFDVDLGLDGDEATMTYGLDILHRSLGAMPARESATSPAAARITAGVVEHIAERMAMEAGVDEGRDARSAGVSRVFEAAAAAGVPMLVLDGSIPDATAFDPLSTRLIEEALAAGDAVIVPAAPVELAGRDRLGWWRVDPVTGVTTDRMDDGTASSFVERIGQNRMANCMALALPGIFTIMNALGNPRQAQVAGVAAGLFGMFWTFQPKLAQLALRICRGG